MTPLRRHSRQPSPDEQDRHFTTPKHEQDEQRAARDQQRARQQENQLDQQREDQE